MTATEMSAVDVDLNNLGITGIELPPGALLSGRSGDVLELLTDNFLN